MNVLTAFSVFVLLLLPSANSELRDFRYEGPGLALITPLGNGIVAIPRGFGTILYLERGNAARYITWKWDESTHCSGISSSGDSAAVCINRRGSDYIVLFSPDSLLESHGPFENAGRTVFDASGNLWFTADGFLHKNGVSTGIELESHTISVDPSGNLIAFCDRDDRICILNTADGVSSVLAAEYRFYSPVFVTCRGIVMIVASSLEGEIVKVSPDGGTCTSLVNGSMPFWWNEAETILYSVTSDDGHTVTAGEIWSSSLDGVNQQITFSPGIHEIRPIALNGAVFAIDAVTGSLIPVPHR